MVNLPTKRERTKLRALIRYQTYRFTVYFLPPVNNCQIEWENNNFGSRRESFVHWDIFFNDDKLLIIDIIQNNTLLFYFDRKIIGQWYVFVFLFFLDQTLMELFFKLILISNWAIIFWILFKKNHGNSKKWLYNRRWWYEMCSSGKHLTKFKTKKD